MKAGIDPDELKLARHFNNLNLLQDLQYLGVKTAELTTRELDGVVLFYRDKAEDIQNFSFYVSDDESRLGVPKMLGHIDLDADTPTNRGERDLLMQEIFMGETYLSKRAIVDAIQRKRFISGADQDKDHAKLWLEQAIEWKILVFNAHERKFKYVGLNADPVLGRN